MILWPKFWRSFRMTWLTKVGNPGWAIHWFRNYLLVDGHTHPLYIHSQEKQLTPLYIINSVSFLLSIFNWASGLIKFKEYQSPPDIIYPPLFIMSKIIYLSSVNQGILDQLLIYYQCTNPTISVRQHDQGASTTIFFGFLMIVFILAIMTVYLSICPGLSVLKDFHKVQMAAHNRLPASS